MKFIGRIKTHDAPITLRLDARRPGFVNQVATANAADHEKIRVFSERLKEFWQKENKATARA